MKRVHIRSHRDILIGTKHVLRENVTEKTDDETGGWQGGET